MTEKRHRKEELEHIAQFRTKWYDKGFLDGNIQGIVLRVTRDGQVECRCHALGYTPFLTFTAIPYAELAWRQPPPPDNPAVRDISDE